MAEQQPNDVVLALFKNETAAPLLIRRADKKIVEFTEDSGFTRVELWHEGTIVLAVPAIDASVRRTSAPGSGERAVALRATVHSVIGNRNVEMRCVISREGQVVQPRTLVSLFEIAGQIVLKSAETRPLPELAGLIKETATFDAGAPRLPWVMPAGEKAKVSVRTYPHDTDEKKNSTAFRWPVLTIERAVRTLPLRIILEQDALVVQRPALRWLERIVSGKPELDDPIGEWVVESELPDQIGTKTWNAEVVDACMRGLHIVRDASPLTLLPLLGADTGFWRFAAVISRSGDKLVTDVMTLQPLGFVSDASPAKITFVGFRTHDGRGLHAKAMVINRRDALSEDGRTLGLENKRGATFESRGASGIRLALQLVEIDDASAVTRVGALDLAFNTKPLEKNWPSAFFHAEIESRDRFPEQIPVFNVDCHLPLASVDPGGQDPVEGEEAVPPVAHQRPGEQKPPSATRQREAPIVIPVERSAESETPVMRLAIEEDTQANFNHTVRMRVVKLQSVKNDRSVVVIDRQPFLVARVDVPQFGAIDIEGTTPELGNWSNVSSQGLVWELRGGADAFTLLLPPQGVGEAMEKGEGYAGVGKDQRADFRFTPPLRAKLATSFFRQRFAEAPWNLRRVLGTPGDRAPGAGLHELDFELLYGLSCSVRTPFLRFAEIAARLGHLAPPMDADPGDTVREKDRQAFKEFVDAWDEKRALFQSRLSVVEPWSERQPDELQITDGLTYRFRESAKLRHPLDRTKTNPETDGLAGGVTWPLESANFFDLLQNARRSDPAGNRLVAPAFSALGGWGQQRASFLNGRVTVISTTAMGRTSYLSIEIIGRIGVYWNRAKHVVIYERSVLPSRQFHLEQERHQGRAVVRKVREYVEVLQPLRTFPEANTGAVPASRGFVLGCEFKSKIMPVSSRWGGDVGKEGFRVPLWQRGAVPADVYPKPHVVLRVATDPDTGREYDEVEIDDPENLVFYANALPGATSNTDDWAAVPWIDFATVALPLPREDGFANGDVTAIPHADPDVAPGLGAFTRRVIPSGRAANVVVDRATESMNAVMRNVTMVRATLDGLKKTLDSYVAKIQQVRDLPAAIGDMLARELRREISPISAAEALLSKLKSSGELQRLETLLGDTVFDEKACDSVANALGAELEARQAKVISEIIRLRAEMLAEIDRLLGQGEAWTDALKTQALLVVEDGFMLLETQLAPFYQFIENSKEQLDALKNGFDQSKATVIAAIDETIRRVRANKAATKTALADLRQRVREELRLAADRAETLLRRALGDQTPKLAHALHQMEDELDAKLAAIDVDGTAEAIVTALNAVRTHAGTLSIEPAIADLTDVLKDVAFDLKTELAGAHANATALIKAAAKKPKEIAREIATEIKNALPDESAKIDQALTAVRIELVNRAKKVCEKVRQPIADSVNAVKARIAALEKAFADKLPIAQLQREVEAFTNRTAREADALVRSVSKDVSDLSDEAKKIGDNVIRLVRAVGDPPRVPNLSFPSGREAIAYLFDEKKREVDITPVVAYVNRVSDALQPLGLDLPTRNLLDRVVPVDLTNFDVSKIFPDFAGMKLAGLFPSLKLPDKANQAVQVRHGIDQQSMRAWLEASVDVPLDKPATIFAFGPVVLRLLAARFTAHVRVEATPGEPARQRAHGQISGNWELQIGGTVIATFRNTRLTFDDSGNINFSISPQNVELNGALKFLSDLIAATGSFNDSGFSIEVTPLPPRIRSVLNLPLPDIQFGAFGISNLRLGCGFGLELRDFKHFVIAVDFNVGRKVAPFTITVFILGGGGWLDSHTEYMIGGKIETTVSIGITAGATLAIALGPIRGGVYIYFGITLEYRTGGGPVLIGIVILIGGVVSLLGIVDISINLLLEAQYGGGRLIGRGTLSAKVKICWCFTLEVSETVEYEFGSAAVSGTEAGADQYELAADEYIAALA